MITNFTPASGSNTAALPITINGTNFRAGATVTIANGTITRAGTSPTITLTRITCLLPLTGLQTGQYNLSVRNTDGSTFTHTNAFEVTNAIPSITTITPISGYNTGSVQITVSGTNFVSGCQATLVNGTTLIPGVISSLTQTKFVGTFMLTGVPAGLYNLSITNPAAQEMKKLNLFTIVNPGAGSTITSINPALGKNNAALPVTITGTKFIAATVYLNQGSFLKVAPATSGKTSTATTLYVTLPLTGVPGGLYNITVRNSEGVNSTAQDIFYVTDQAWISSARGTTGRSTVGSRPDVSLVTEAGIPEVVSPSDRKVVNGGGR